MTMTQSQKPSRPWSRVALLCAGAAASLAVMVWAIERQAPAEVEAGQAGDESGTGQASEPADNPTALDDDGRFTGPGQVWPPQPKGATDIVERSAADLVPVAQAQRLEQLDQAALPGRSPSEVLAADDTVTDALGQRHNLITAEVVDGSTNLIYYSLSTNQTIELTVTGDVIADLVIHRPEDFQPELSNDEKQAAVDIARAHWQTKGDARIDSLQGFSILAFQPGGAYYDTRMVYVSFHVDEDARPELLAWVDLVDGQVTKSEVDR